MWETYPNCAFKMMPASTSFDNSTAEAKYINTGKMNASENKKR